MKKCLFFAATLLMSIASFAQWTKPAAPAAEPLKVGEECYLYNKEADGFLVGANDWGTRASVSNTLGHKVKIEAGTVDGSYYISNYVLYGWMANQWGYMFIDAVDQVYVDNTKDGKKNNQYTFESVGDNLFKIGLSDANEIFNTAGGYENAYLGTKTDVVSNSRIFVVEPGAEGLLTWYFVATSNYETYVAAVKQYEAAVALGKVITEAEALPGVDATVLSDAKAAYGNSSSTAEALAAAQQKLEAAMKDAKYNVASLENPIEVLKMNGIATDFTDGTCPGWGSTTGAQNKQAANGNNAKDFNATGNHYENWNGSAFTPGTISATVSGIPAGVYHLNSLAFTNTGAGAYLFAGGDRTPVNATQIDVDQSFDAWAYAADGKLTVGLDIPAKGPNWVGLDNVNLYYVGAGEASTSYLLGYISEKQRDYEGDKAENVIAYSNDLYEAYSAAKEKLEAAKGASTEEFGAAYTAFYSAVKALDASVDAFAPYMEIVNKANAWRVGTTSESEDVMKLCDYLESDEAPAAGVYNGNGGAIYVIENGALTSEQITAEAKYLEKLLNDAMANAMSDGDDCTELLKNPNFTEAGGWEAAQGIDWPVGTEAFRVFQSWGKYCDVKQSLAGLQNGIYEMNLQAVYKADGDAEIRQTYAYINDFDTKIGITSDEEILNSAEDASAAFAEGKYPVKVYGLVTDNKMQIGIANRLRTAENGILWAGGVKLIFRAKNAEACEALLTVLKAKADALKESIYGAEEAAALSSAVADAEGVSGDEGYAALVALKKALDAANTGVTLYSELNVALANLREAIDGNPNAETSVKSQAEALYATASAAYEAKSYNDAQADQTLSDVKAMVSTVKMSKPSQGEVQDFTDLIVNNNFDPAKGSKDEKRIDGWVVEGALNGYKSYSCSFNKGTFNLSQTLEGLPKGKYKVTVNTYYRAGSYEEEGANINAGKDTHLMKFYANSSVDNYVTSIMNLSEGSKGVTLPEGIGTKEINGITVPDGTGASVKCYEQNLFLNELTFNVGDDGKVVIGLRLDETIGTNDYTVVGPWHLYYYAEEKVTEEDYTDLIVNNNFDPAKGSKDEKRIDGWVVEGALNGYKSYSCSFNKGTFNLSQDLAGLPKGKYKVTVNTFYRAGSYDEEAANINAGKDTHLMKFYANTSVDNYVTSIMNLSEGSKGVTLPEGIGTKEINGITVPDGTGASVKCYEAGLFLNELTFYVGDDGKATIGLRLDETIGTNDYTVVGPWHLYYYGEEKVTEEDYSDLIVNNNFDPAKGSKDEKRIDGWNVEGALNGYKSYSCSFNKGTFYLSQDLAGLPEGNYKVTVNTYYRAGSYEEEGANINAGKDTHLMKFFANTSVDNYVTSIMNLSEGSKGVTLPEGIGTKEINGITVPDGTGASVKCYEAGLFLNELEFKVGKDGKATIGLRLDETIGTNDYTVVGPWHLYYYGKGSGEATAIECVAAPVEEVTPVAYYSISGAKLAAPQKGVNIVKLSNGKTVKMLVK